MKILGLNISPGLACGPMSTNVWSHVIQKCVLTKQPTSVLQSKTVWRATLKTPAGPIRWPGNTWGRSLTFKKLGSINQVVNHFICHASSYSVCKPWFKTKDFKKTLLLEKKRRLCEKWNILTGCILKSECKTNLNWIVIKEKLTSIPINCSSFFWQIH